MKMGLIIYLDTIVVPLSLFLTVGYHAYLWHVFKNRPSLTTIGANSLRRRDWFLAIKEGDEKTGMLAVQSLRNTLMATILTATVAILINLTLAALASNAMDARRLFNGLLLFGLHSEKIFALKYGLASLFLLAGFLCSSMALGFLIDANFLINAIVATQGKEEEEVPAGATSFRRYVRVVMFERGFALATVGNRALCVAFPLLLWMFGPVPGAVASVGLVWGLYELDFGGQFVIPK